MKTLDQVPVSSRTQLPDFGARPRHLKLNRIETVRSLGKLKLRPIRPGDEPEMVRFHERISEENAYMRYFEYLDLDHRTSHERLVQVCTNMSDSYALVVERLATGDQPAEILAIGRLTKTVNPYAVSFDTLIADDVHERTIRNILLSRLIAFAHAFGFQMVIGELLLADRDTLNLCRKIGFSLQTVPEDGLVRVMMNL